MRLKIVIADDHQLMRCALRTVLSADPGVEVVGEAESGRQALDVIARMSPDIALLDVRMPGLDGLAVLDEVRQRHPSVRVIMVSALEQDEVVHAAFKRGAAAFVLKRVDPRDLCAVVRQVAERTVFHPPVTEAPSEANRPQLTPRQLRVLAGLARGLCNKELAKELWLSEQTVKFHLSNIYRALGVSSRAEAIRVAYEHQLVASPALDAA
jgi:DNA-binding NarL/FixJ family response regulator